MKKKALGKGLNALISDIPNELLDLDESSSIKEISIGLIIPNKNQPRKVFDPQLIEELSISIKENGVIQPIVVSPMGEGKYQIVVGERRYRASLKAGLKTIPCLVKELSEEKILEWALIENLQREDLNPIETAMAYQELMVKMGKTQEELANYIGKSRSAVANSLRLLKLPESIKKDVLDGLLTEGHARSIVSLQHIDEMIELRNLIVNQKLSVREAESYLKKAKQKEKSLIKEPIVSGQKDLQEKVSLNKLEQDLSYLLDKTVKVISKTPVKGKVEIYYNSLKEFEELQSILKSLESLKKQFYI